MFYKEGEGKMSYFTIKDEGMAEFEERKSVFIGYVKKS